MRDSCEVWTGKASSYDRVRPTPPPALLDLLKQLIQMPHPALVVDLGSGTGPSTAIWGERAKRVIGIEPNADMRQEAVRKVGNQRTAITTRLSRCCQTTSTSRNPALRSAAW